MSQAADAMRMASKEGISLKEAWAKVKGKDGSAPASFESPDTQVERASLGIAPKKTRPDPEAF